MQLKTLLPKRTQEIESRNFGFSLFHLCPRRSHAALMELSDFSKFSGLLASCQSVSTTTKDMPACMV